MANFSDDKSALDALRSKHKALLAEVGKVIVGQDQVIREVTTSIFAGGHILLVGVPGLAKTLLVNTIAEALGLSFNRIQFTPDLMPSDIVGSEILDESRQFKFVKGPLFSNIVLADEINRTPPKTQAALLEAMQERAVTAAGKRYPLPGPFFVLATQNPIEQEGTYPLPEAQLDRFLMHVVIDYPDADAERQILHLARSDYRQGIPQVDIRLTEQQVMEARQAVSDIYMAEPVEQYLLALILATRDAASLDPELARWTAFGASPRGTIALDRCARALAWLDGRDYVTPDDIRTMAFDVLRHRILLTFEAEAEGMTADTVLQRLIDRVPVTA